MQFITHPSQLPQAEVFGVDLETTGKDYQEDEIVLVQFSDGEEIHFLKDLTLLEKFSDWFLDSGIIKIFHNAVFDLSFLQASGIRVENSYDTMIAEKLINSGRERDFSLVGLARRHLGVSIDKGRKPNFQDGLTPELLDYAKDDTIHLLEIRKKQLPKLPKRIAKIEFALLPYTAELNCNGFLVDKVQWRKKIVELEDHRVEVRAQLLASLGAAEQLSLLGGSKSGINLNSREQIIKAFKLVGIALPGLKREKLDRLAVKYPLVRTLTDFRDTEKNLSTYGEVFLNRAKKNGRIYGHFNQCGTVTGRFSCDNPNMQNIPPIFAVCLIASDGQVLISLDYSQIELRILAKITQDKRMGEAYQNDEDLHQVTADILGIPRKDAKGINFGVMYGMGAYHFSLSLGISRREAEKFLGQYFQTYRGAARWFDKQQKTAGELGYVESLGGRRRYLDAVWDYSRIARNTPIQASAADILDLGIIKIKKRLGDRVKLVCTVHDEIVLESDENLAEENRRWAELEMVEAAREFLEEVPAKVDSKITKNWVKE